MTLAEYERLRAEYAARGEFPEICCRIDDLPSGPSAWLADLAGRLLPGLRKEAVPELEAEP